VEWFRSPMTADRPFERRQRALSDALRHGRIGPADVRLLGIWCGMLTGGVAAGWFFPQVVQPDILYRPHRVEDFRVTCILAGVAVALLAVGITYLTLYRMNRYLFWMSQRDPLTGLYHHGRLAVLLERALQDMLNTSSPLSLLIADIDHFKEVNDRWGHLMGDQVLQRVAAVLRTAVGTRGVVCRMGGEEFAIVLPQMTSEAAVQLAEQLRRAVAQSSSGFLPTVTISVGIASVPPAARSATELIKQADDAMYEAKHRGRNQVCELGRL
jgi:diguanylate cyclase (GGDEF)-like protein